MAADGVEYGMPCRRKERILCTTCMLAGIDGCADEIGRLTVPLERVPVMALLILPLVANEVIDHKATMDQVRDLRPPGVPPPK